MIQKFGALSEDVARRFTRQMLLALDFMHANGVIHRDLKVRAESDALGCPLHLLSLRDVKAGRWLS